MAGTFKITELSLKIAFLNKWAVDTGLEGLDSVNGLARSISVADSTLKHAINNKMTLDVQKKIANAYGFSVEWPEWCDRRATALARRDSAAQFEDKFRKHKSSGLRLTILADRTMTKLDRRFADFRFMVAGSFDPDKDGQAIPLVLSMSFDRRGHLGRFDDSSELFVVWLRQVDLKIDHKSSTGGGRIEADHIECRTDSDSNFSAHLGGLEPPWWIVSAGNDRLMGRRLPNDGNDCVCVGFCLGDEMTATMTARVNNCDIEMIGAPFRDQPATKQQFMNHLLRLHALDGAEAILGTQRLKVVEKHD